MIDHRWTALVTIVALLVYLGMGLQVAAARGKSGIEAPAMTGHPALERARSAHLQIWSWLVGTVVMVIGVAMIHTGNMSGEPFAGIGSVIVVVSMLLFAWMVFRAERTDASARPVAAPAE